MKHDERLKQQRERRKAEGNASTHRYEKTPNGFLMRLYRNMKSRVSGVQHKKAHLYKGKYLLPRSEFYEWARTNLKFWEMYTRWVRNGYNRKLTPTVDRINPANGYDLLNMEWVTHSENSRRSSITRKLREDIVRSNVKALETGRNDQSHSQE